MAKPGRSSAGRRSGMATRCAYWHATAWCSKWHRHNHWRITMGYGLVGILVVLFALLVSTFRILREYERGVVFQLGRFWAVKGPGLVILIPMIQQMVKVDLRTIVLDVPTQ